MHMMHSDHRASYRRTLCELLNELPGSDDFLFWHLVDTRAHVLPFPNCMIVEPYSDGTMLRRLHDGIDQCTRAYGDETVEDDLCNLLNDLFGTADPLLVEFLDRYMVEHGKGAWRSAAEWLADLHDTLRGLSGQESDVLALRRKWIGGQNSELRVSQLAVS
ncbi:hypothetical protein [Streptomyces zaomyceticus]|uniref:hypothetical protein n=1 Tax=Streptomyces zaomyceticus TaxID=68286 RepID=UPI0036CCA8A6